MDFPPTCESAWPFVEVMNKNAPVPAGAEDHWVTEGSHYLWVSLKRPYTVLPDDVTS